MQRPMTRWTAGVLACTLLAACAPPPTLAPDGASGLEGVTLRGPVCPGPARLDDPACDDAPFSTRLKVVANDGTVLARFTTGADGTFHVPLSPGAYTLASDAATPLPRLTPVRVVVSPQAFARVELHFDTGIR